MTIHRPFRILVLCTGNSARSQIAEALLANKGKGRVHAASAGSDPAARVNPYALEILHEHGIPWAGHEPRGIDTFQGQRFDLVITVCDDARDACPYFSGARVQVHWGLPDPAAAASPDEARRAFRRTYDALESRIEALLALPFESMPPEALAERAGELAKR